MLLGTSEISLVLTVESGRAAVVLPWAWTSLQLAAAMAGSEV